MKQVADSDAHVASADVSVGDSIGTRYCRVEFSIDARVFRSALRALEKDPVVMSVMSFLKNQEGEYQYLGLPSTSFSAHRSFWTLRPDCRNIIDKTLDELQNPMWPDWTRRSLELTPSGFKITRCGQEGHMWPSATMTRSNMLEVMSNGVTVVEIRDQIYRFAQALKDGTATRTGESKRKYDYPGQVTEYQRPARLA